MFTLGLFYYTAECSQPQPIANGTVVVHGTQEGSTVSYECEIGFSLVGSTIRTCLHNATWSGEEPLCEGKRYFSAVETVQTIKFQKLFSISFSSVLRTTINS